MPMHVLPLERLYLSIPTIEYGTGLTDTDTCRLGISSKTLMLIKPSIIVRIQFEFKPIIVKKHYHPPMALRNNSLILIVVCSTTQDRNIYIFFAKVRKANDNCGNR